MKHGGERVMIWATAPRQFGDLLTDLRPEEDDCFGFGENNKP